MRQTTALLALLLLPAAPQAFAAGFEADLAAMTAQVRSAAEARTKALDLTWEQIEAKYSPDWPLLPFEGHKLSLRGFCHVNGQTFELRGPKKTITVCRDYGYDDVNCHRSEEVKVSVPALVEYEDCPDSYDDRRDRCRNPVKMSYTRPLTYQVDVYERDRDEDRRAMFTKSYTVPPCP